MTSFSIDGNISARELITSLMSSWTGSGWTGGRAGRLGVSAPWTGLKEVTMLRTPSLPSPRGPERVYHSSTVSPP